MSARTASRTGAGEWRVGTRRTRLEAAMTGTFKKVTDKGFGFIADTKGQEYFFHQSGVQGVGFDELREGQSVEFDVGRGPKGPRAENVRVQR